MCGRLSFTDARIWHLANLRRDGMKPHQWFQAANAECLSGLPGVSMRQHQARRSTGLQRDPVPKFGVTDTPGTLFILLVERTSTASSQKCVDALNDLSQLLVAPDGT